MLLCFTSFLSLHFVSITVLIIGTVDEFYIIVLGSGGNITLNNQSMNNVPRKMRTAVFLKILSTTQVCAFCILMYSEQVPTKQSFSLVAFCNDGLLFAWMVWNQSVFEMFSLINVDPAPLSSMYCTDCLLCDEKIEVELIVTFYLKEKICRCSQLENFWNMILGFTCFQFW